MIHAGEPLTVTARVKNAGSSDGDETVEVYLIPRSKEGAPLRALVGFQKVHLVKGETRTVQTVIDPRQLSLVAADGSRSVQAGEYDLYVGGGQPAPDAGILLRFRIEGSSPMAP